MAVAALIISTVTALWTIGWSVFVYARSSRTSFDVRGSLAVTATGKAFIVAATNRSRRATEIKLVYFEVKGSSQQLLPFVWMPVSHPLPRRLEVDETWNGMLDPDELRKELAENYAGPPWRIRACIIDATGKVHRAKWYSINRGPSPGGATA